MREYYITTNFLIDFSLPVFAERLSWLRIGTGGSLL
jgi:hypothetical protein